jgi:hypothetical protein
MKIEIGDYKNTTIEVQELKKGTVFVSDGGLYFKTDEYASHLMRIDLASGATDSYLHYTGSVVGRILPKGTKIVLTV